MARIFTTKFNFNHAEYDAIVSVINTNGKLNFNIRILDAELFDLIPGGQVGYTGKEGYKELSINNEKSLGIINSIASSIEDHLVEATR